MQIPKRDWDSISFGFREFHRQIVSADRLLDYVRSLAEPYETAMGSDARMLTEISHRLGAIVRDLEVHIEHLGADYEDSAYGGRPAFRESED